MSVRHARAEALDDLEPLLAELRCLVQIREKSRGVFYRGSKPYLHFHEDPAGFFADVRLNPRGDFDRLRVSELDERAILLQAVRRSLSDESGSRRRET